MADKPATTPFQPVTTHEHKEEPLPPPETKGPKPEDVVAQEPEPHEFEGLNINDYVEQLQPFAKLAKFLPNAVPDEQVLIAFGQEQLTVGQIRRLFR